MTPLDARSGGGPAGKLMALDIGQARIGVAVCDPLQLGVRPLTVIQRRSRQEDFARLAELVRREEVQAIICGLPLNMNGSEGEQAQIVRRWARRLVNALVEMLGAAPTVIFWDERLSSHAAQSFLAGGKKRTPDDAIAAAVILQSYLDARSLPEAIDYGRIER